MAIRQRSPLSPGRGGGGADDHLGAAAGIIDQLDARGAWTEPGIARDDQGKKIEPPGGIISSATFVKNMKTLSRFVEASR